MGFVEKYVLIYKLTNLSIILIGDVGIGIVRSIVDYLEPSPPVVSAAVPDFDIISNQVPNEETLKKGNFLRSITLTPTSYFSTPNSVNPTMNHHQQFSTPTPSPGTGFHYSTTAVPYNYATGSTGTVTR